MVSLDLLMNLPLGASNINVPSYGLRGKCILYNPTEDSDAKGGTEALSVEMSVLFKVTISPYKLLLSLKPVNNVRFSFR